MISDADIRQRWRLDEDSDWEFKQIEFSGDRLRGGAEIWGQSGSPPI